MVPDRRLIGLLVFLGISLLGGPVWGQGPKEEKKPVIKPPTLPELAKLYLELELPLPPRDAKFAKIALEENINGCDKKRYQIYWCLNKGPKFQFWNGLSEVYFEPNSTTEIIEQIYDETPTPDQLVAVLKVDYLSRNHFSDHRQYQEMLFAIQCHLLGHHELARFYYWRCLKSDIELMDKSLVIIAWNHWVEQLTDPIRDRRAVGAKLQWLNRKYAYLSSHEEESLNQSNENDRFMEVLKLTLEPSRAKAGSVEALIDALVDARDKEDTDSGQLEIRDRWDRREQIENRKRASRFDPRSDPEIRLAKLGFEAIPALIDHFDDPRLTRKAMYTTGQPLRGFPGQIFSDLGFFTVGNKVQSILGSYFDLDLEIKKRGTEITKSELKEIWEKIKIEDEYSFLLNFLEKSQDKIKIYRTISDRFPEKLIIIYKKIIEKKLTNQDIEPFVYYIVDSNMPRKEKVDLLLLAIENSHFPFRIAALGGLLEVDPKICREICYDLLSKLPKEVQKSENGGPVPHLELACLAFCFDEPKASEILLPFVKKLPLPAKMAFLCCPSYGYYYRPSKKFTINFFYNFLEDKEVFLYEQKFWNEYGYHLDGLHKIEVRNFVAKKILDFLGVEVLLTDETPPEDWDRIRQFVKNEVERRREEEKRK